MNENSRPKILLVDDDAMSLEALVGLFQEDYTCVTASSGPRAVDQVRRISDIAAVVMDIKMPGMDGIVAAREIRSLVPAINIIFHTAFPGRYDEDEINEQEQPFEFVRKGSPVSRLTRAVRNAVRSYLSGQTVREPRFRDDSTFGLIGQSRAMQEVYALLRRVQKKDGRVMITGETGTGKELVARAIHAGSSRQHKRLAIYRCNRRGQDLTESELFGHVRGAFTGAIGDRKGLFEHANSGIVFLDEIADLDHNTQTKILGVLESGEFTRVGSPDVQYADVRVLCATHKDLDTLMAEGAFREDLYYRLKGIRIHLPPLRERKEDIKELVECFARRFTIEQGQPPRTFSASAMQAFLDYDWPGNVRHLLGAVESLIVLSDADEISGDEVCRYLEVNRPTRAPQGSRAYEERMTQFRRQILIETLVETNNNVSAAARILDMDRGYLSRLIRKLDIDMMSKGTTED
ncbi:MAG: sigma-54 dependent transcriptional regulator [candidate division Zixibacteria bacterium]|nr:sigma-54 dependent transcriptional regulator [candidate division Zixibacteria bacterium]